MSTQIPHSEKLNQKRLRAKVWVFAVTCLASFCLLALAWPLMVRGYESQTSIVVNLLPQEGNAQEFQTLLANALRSKTQEASLNQMLDQVASKTPLRNPVFLEGQLEQIRKSLGIKTDRVDAESLQVRLVFRGLGSRDEQVFLQLFADEVSESLVTMAARSSLGKDLQVHSVAGVRFRKRVRQIESDLVQLQQDLGIDGQMACRSPDSGKPFVQSSSPFRQASHSKSSKSSLDTDSGGDALESFSSDRARSVDFDSVYAQLEELKEFVFSEPSDAFQNPVVQIPLTIAPVGGTPHPKQLLLLLVMAVAAGLYTAIHFDPFARRGFDNLAHLTSSLRIPVVATLPNNPLTAAEGVSGDPVYRKTPWGNYIVPAASLFLSCFLSVVIVFCLLHSEIRRSFWENPFHGLTHIIWYVLGY
jgi:hypothetical protein